MQKYYRENEIFIGLDEHSMPMFIPLDVFMSDVITKNIKLKKNSQGVTLQTLFEQIHQANLISKTKRPKKASFTAPKVVNKADKDKAAVFIKAFEKSLEGSINEEP